MSLFEPLWAAAFTLWGSPVSWTEVIGFVLAVWMVVCNMRVNMLAWPLAIASSALYGLLFANSKLYGEAGLQLLFIAVAAWGWWQWRFGKENDGHALHVRWLVPQQRFLVIGAALLAWPLLGLLLDHATDTDVPYFDAFPTAGSLVGTWLLGRKFVENWPAWVVVNLVSIGLFAWKGLWLTVVLYALFALLALVGWRRWQQLAAAGAH